MDTPQLLDPATVAAELIGKPEAAPQPLALPQTAPEAEALSPFVDKSGNRYRPGFHRANPDGSPFLNRFGNLMPAPKARKPKAETALPAESQPKPEPQPPAPVQPETKPEAVKPPSAPAWTEAERTAAAAPVAPAVTTAPAAQAEVEVYDSSDDAAEVIALAIFFLIGILFGAPEEATPADGEQKKLVKITAGLIRTTGWKGSAWWAAGLSWSAYLLRFLRKPKAAAKVQGWVDELRAKTKLATPVAAAPEPKPNPGLVGIQPNPFPGIAASGFIERPGH